MNKLNLSLLLIVLIIFTTNIPGFSADNSNSLQINSINPLRGTVGKELKVEITGNGFDSTSRVALIPQPYPDYPRLDVNDFSSPCFSAECGGADWIDAQDNLLFICNRRKHITIADLSNPIMPIKTGAFSNKYNDNILNKIVLDGHYAYIVAIGGDGRFLVYSLQIMDLSDLSNPKLSGEIEIAYWSVYSDDNFFCDIADLKIKNKTVYITGGQDGLRVVDASVPSTPRIIATYDGNDLASNNINSFLGFDIDGDYAYIAAANSGMAVMDISNPSKPSLVKVINTSGNCRDVAVSGQTAYAANMANGMMSIDITTPSDPNIAGTLPLYGLIDKIQIKGNYTWLFASDDRQYHMVDIRRPLFPVLVASASMDLLGNPEYNCVTFSDNMAYALEGTCMMLAPIPLELSGITVKSSNTLSFTIPAPLINAHYKIRIFNDLFSVESQQSISFKNSGPITNSPVDYPDQVIKKITVGTFPVGVFLTPDGEFAYVPSNRDDTISVVRISDHSVIKTIAAGYPPEKIIFSPNGDYAYVTNRGGTVSVISASDYSIIKTIKIDGYPSDIVITPDGSSLYVANSSKNCVSVIRTSDYTVTGTIPVGTNLSDLCIRPDGSYIYVLNAHYLNSSISVIRSSDNQIETTIQEDGLQAFAMTPNGDFLYVSTSSGYALVIQTSDNRVIKKIPEITGDVVTATPDGDYIYAAGRGNKLCVLQSSDQTIVKTVYPVCSPSLMTITPKGDYMYFARQDEGKLVSILRTSDNKIVKTIPVGKSPSGIAATPDGKYVYISNGWSKTVTVIANSHDIDNDADGFTENQGDCNDYAPSIYPGAPEICGDGIDQDCDGQDQVCCAITVISPNGGETWETGSTHQITWDSAGSECWPSVKITYSTDGGGSWHDIIASCLNTGAYSWTIPDSFETNQAIIKIEDTSSAGYFDISNAGFMINNDNDSGGGSGGDDKGGGDGGCFISSIFK